MTQPPAKRSCTDLHCLLLLAVSFPALAGVTFYAFFTGKPYLLQNPTDSAGETCGQGKHAGKPNLLYYDLTQCAGISAAVGSCPSPQVCVQECPRTYWTSAQGKSSGLEKFCNNVTARQMEDKTISMSKLVVERRCPAYILPSTLVMGRCLSTFGLERREDNGRAEAKIKAMRTEYGKALDVDGLNDGVDYVIKSLNNRDIGETFLAYLASDWLPILISFLLTIVISLILTVLINLATKVFLLASMVLCVVIMMAGSVLSLMRYRELEASTEDTFLSPVINSMFSYKFNKNTWLVIGIIIGVISLISFIFMFLGFLLKKIPLAILLIQRAGKDLCSKKTLFLIPILQSVSQVLLVFFSITVASFLISSGSAEFRVVDACSSETCKNVDTGDMFALNNVCDPDIFAECTGCPRAQCVHHKFRSSVLAYILQVCNILVIIWLLLYVHSFGCMLMTGAFAVEYWNLSSVWVWNSFKKISRYHLGTVALGSFVPFICCMKTGLRCLNKKMYANTFVHGDGFMDGRKIYTALLQDNSGRLLGLDIVATFILLMIKLIIVSFAAASSFALFSLEAISSHENEFSCQFVPIFTVTMGAYTIASNFISIFSMAVETMLLRFLEDVGQPEGQKDNCYFKYSDLKQILENKQLEMGLSIDCNENNDIMSNVKYKQRG